MTTETTVLPGTRVPTPAARALNIAVAADWATVSFCCSIAGVKALRAAASAAASSFDFTVVARPKSIATVVTSNSTGVMSAKVTVTLPRLLSNRQRRKSPLSLRIHQKRIGVALEKVSIYSYSGMIE
jgi:hypothetical protein